MDEQIAAFKVDFGDSEVDEFLLRARNVLEAGWLIPGPGNAELERRFAEFVGAAQAVAVSSGTAALEIAARVLGLSGKAVLVPANTNYATVEAVLRAGCRPVLYDSGLYPDLAAIESAFTTDVAGVVLVHIGGYLSPDLPAIIEWAQRRSLPVIEDASHAHGAQLNDKGAGTFGTVAAFSMFATKVITTAEGGLVTTADRRLAEQCRRYRDQGKDDDGLHHVVFGSAWRMSELHAALGIVQMPHLAARVVRSNEFAARYVAGIDHAAVHVPHEPMVRYSGHKFIVTTDNGRARTSLRAHLAARGVATAKGVYEVPLHRQPVLSLGAGTRFPIADSFAESHLCLPMWKGLSCDSIDRVIEAVNSWPGV